MLQSQWIAALDRSVSQLYSVVVQYVPTFLAAVALLVVGWLVAHGARIITSRIAEAVRRRLPGYTVAPAAGRFDIDQRRLAHLCGRFAFWLIFVIFLGAAADTLGLPVVATWLSGVSRLLPRLLLAALIVVAGLIAGSLAREAATAAAQAGRLDHPMLLGQVVQALIVLAAAVTGVDQIGLDSTFLTVVLTVVMGSLFGGMALAFGLGARTAVANLLAMHYARQVYRVGQTLKLGATEGRIHSITGFGVILETDAGRVLVPGKRLSERVSMLVATEG